MTTFVIHDLWKENHAMFQCMIDLKKSWAASPLSKGRAVASFWGGTRPYTLPLTS